MQYLDQISTHWSKLELALRGQAEAAAAARQSLFQRYTEAIRRYLLTALGDPEAADDLTQEFALCVVQGKFHRVDPERGRFRDYVKAVLRRLAGRHLGRRQKQDRPLPPDSPAWDVLTSRPEHKDRSFYICERGLLLARAWEALAKTRPGLSKVLRFKACHPEMSSAEMTQEFGKLFDQPFTAAGVRQTTRRARDLFAELLVDEVARSIETPTPEALADKLSELQLLPYCRPALERRQSAN
jgi:RNA polymerase sigma-70 factor (ECF subfamily)